MIWLQLDLKRANQMKKTNGPWRHREEIRGYERVPAIVVRFIFLATPLS